MSRNRWLAALPAALLMLLHDTHAGSAAGFRDVPYQVLPGYHPQTADIYLPTAGKGPYPAVVFVHGGGWGLGSPRMEDLVDVLGSLAARGYVVVGINYRFHGEAKFPAQIQDVKAAIRWLRSNAAMYGVDATRIGIWGASAGGYLAALAGTSCGVVALEPAAVAGGAPVAMPGTISVNSDPKQSDCVQAVVDWYGPVDFPAMDGQALPGSMQHGSPTSAESQLLGCALARCPVQLLKNSNPLTWADRSDPPFLIMHGEADTAVPPGQSVELDRALRAAGVSSTLVLLPGLNHGFAGADEAQKQQIRQRVFEFFDRTLAQR